MVEYVDRTLQSQPRTNNSAEAWHIRLQYEFVYSHPSVWKFISTLRRAPNARGVEYEQLEAETEPRRKEAKYERCDERIYKLLTEYEDHDYVEYLRAIAHNLPS